MGYYSSPFSWPSTIIKEPYSLGYWQGGTAKLTRKIKITKTCPSGYSNYFNLADLEKVMDLHIRLWVAYAGGKVVSEWLKQRAIEEEIKYIYSVSKIEKDGNIGWMIRGTPR